MSFAFKPWPKHPDLCFLPLHKQIASRSTLGTTSVRADGSVSAEALSLLHVPDNLERAIDSVKTDQIDESQARAAWLAHGCHQEGLSESFLAFPRMVHD